MKSDSIVNNVTKIDVTNADRILVLYLYVILLYRPRIKNGSIVIVIKNATKNGCPLSDNKNSIIMVSF